MTTSNPGALSDPARLKAVHDLTVGGVTDDAVFDGLTALAAKLLGAPVAALTLLTAEQQCFRSRVGLPGLPGPHPVTPAGDSFCQHVVMADEPFLVEDARHNTLVSGSSFVTDHGVAAYLGVPLRTRDAHVVGALCVADHVPRRWLPRETEILIELAGFGMGELEARSSRALLASLPFADLPSPLYVIELETRRLLAVNDAALAQYGYTREEFLGLRADDIRPKAEVSHLLRELERSGAAFRKRGTWTHRRKDGALIVVDVRSQEILLGARPCLAVMALDVTDQRKAERRLQHVTAKSPAVLFAMEVKDRVMTDVWVSRNVTAMLGYTPEETKEAEWWTENLHPDDRASVMRAVEDLYATSSFSHEHRFQCKDGSYRWVRAQMRVLRDASGVPVEFVGSWIDVSEFRLLEDQLRQSQKMEAVGRVAGGVAHDFNNILTTISGHSELVLADLAPGDPLREDIEEIRKAAERAAGLTRQLLAFSRKQVLRPEPLDVGVVVSELERMLRRVVSEEVELVTSTPSGLGCVHADRIQLEQVLMNLIVNARDALEGRGTITIGLERRQQPECTAPEPCGIPAGDYLVLSVADNGCGIPRDVLEHIFEPFFTTKAPGRGTGLGLSTVYGIVRQSGGYVQVDSKTGRGSVFRIQLPVVAGPVAAPEPRRSIQAVAGGTETVLLVEDEVAVRELATRILGTLGYRVIAAEDGGAALLEARNAGVPIDILVTDLVMPRMSGGELAAELKQLLPRLKVLFMSGYSEEAISGSGGVDPRTAFLEKPFTISGLGRAIRHALDSADPGLD